MKLSNIVSYMRSITPFCDAIQQTQYTQTCISIKSIYVQDRPGFPMGRILDSCCFSNTSIWTDQCTTIFTVSGFQLSSNKGYRTSLFRNGLVM